MYKVRVPPVIKILLKAIIVPVIVVFGLSKFNLFEFITLVPKDYQYEVGLTFYLAVTEAIYGLIQTNIEQNKANIKCIFYLLEVDKDIKNTPTIVCSGNVGVATINCHIVLGGNLKRLRKCNFILELPSWLTSQVNVSDTVLKYSNNQLCWEFDRLLPTDGIINQVAEYKNKLSLIKNVDENNLAIKLEPYTKKLYGVKFETNGFRVQNGE